MTMGSIKLSLGAGSDGIVEIDGFDLSKHTSCVEYKAEAGKLALITITLCADVEADLSVLPENIRVLIDKMPEDKTVSSIAGKTKHFK